MLYHHTKVAKINSAKVAVLDRKMSGSTLYVLTILEQNIANRLII